MKPSILQDLGRSHQQGGWETGPISMSAPSPLSLPTLILWFANYFEVTECLGSAFWFYFASPLRSTFLKGHVTQRIRGRPGISSFLGWHIHFWTIPPTDLPQALTHPATLTHTIYWKPLFFWSRLWLCSQNQAEGKCFLRKPWTRELHSHLIFLHQDDFVCSSSRLFYPFFFSCKTCSCWGKKSTGIYFSPSS